VADLVESSLSANYGDNSTFIATSNLKSAAVETYGIFTAEQTFLLLN
jgi:hypothetical protein